MLEFGMLDAASYCTVEPPRSLISWLCVEELNSRKLNDVCIIKQKKTSPNNGDIVQPLVLSHSPFDQVGEVEPNRNREQTARDGVNMGH